MQQAVNRLSQFMEGSGVRCPPVIFTSDCAWPKLDRQVLEKIDESLEKRTNLCTEVRIIFTSMARKLGPLKVKCESAVSLPDYGRPMADYCPDGRTITHVQCQRWYHTESAIKEGRHILLGMEADPAAPMASGKAAPLSMTDNN